MIEIKNGTKGAFLALLLVTLGYVAPSVSQSALDAATRRLAAALLLICARFAMTVAIRRSWLPALPADSEDYIEARIAGRARRRG
jgi:hypothetical protein